MMPARPVTLASVIHHVAKRRMARRASRGTSRVHRTRPTYARTSALRMAKPPSTRSASSGISHQLLDAPRQAFLGLLHLDDEAANVRPARLALDLRPERRLSAAHARDGLAEVAQREEARGDARPGTAFEEVRAGEREASFLAPLQLQLAKPHVGVGADVLLELRGAALARELAAHLLEDLVRDAARLDEVLHDLADERARERAR